jgi:hypothetical protein
MMKMQGGGQGVGGNRVMNHGKASVAVRPFDFPVYAQSAKVEEIPFIG